MLLLNNSNNNYDDDRSPIMLFPIMCPPTRVHARNILLITSFYLSVSCLILALYNTINTDNFSDKKLNTT